MVIGDANNINIDNWCWWSASKEFGLCSLTPVASHIDGCRRWLATHKQAKKKKKKGNTIAT
jgi:hypothetical protein